MRPPVVDGSILTLPTASGVPPIRIRLADRFVTRLIGLLGQATPPPPGTGLMLVSRGGVHTLGMRYPIDILALDSALTILRVRHAVAPGRILRAPAGTAATLELAAGTVPAGLTGHRFHSEEVLA